ncbi:hypothetical protein TL16_g10307 [Triparma laevis f. inornata]|uniref:Alliinase C-terminal domain-containing protein n=2 Tax=Triparma laevis TaxID=1534972 RepID=A0A9W7FSH3_9STRA|nr:hypothetical protein TL16_g10307 [Triparma laevis f. inornata]GMI18217.1 hypothetical protein TrLO_g15057 [Triparma laevis f. longispina]
MSLVVRSPLPTLLLLSLLPTALSTLPSTCPSTSPTDLCLPGGKFDPLQNTCLGYNGQTCFGCYTGEFCDTIDKESCSLNLGGGQPAWAQEYWESTLGQPCSETGADFQTEYTFTTAYPPLLKEIKELHANVGNAETEGYEIVLGVGATGVMNSLLYALAASSPSNITLTITAQAPHYGNYVPQTQNTYAYSTHPSILNFETDVENIDKHTYEILTYPNNPDGVKRTPIASKVIYDCIYYWPQFTEVDKKLEYDVMIFSASKHTGHAGSRLGWALVKDKGLAGLMRDFGEREIGVSMDSQIRYTYTLNYLNEQLRTGVNSFYDFSTEVMKGRFDAVTEIFRSEETGEVETVNDISFVNCDTRGAYVWLVHEDESVDLEALLEGEALITGTPGVSYGVGTNYARIQMMARSVEIDDFVERLTKFLGKEYDETLAGKYAAAKTAGVREVKKVVGC